MYCGHIPGFCGKRSDCKDTLCEGHPGLHQADGGATINHGEREDERLATTEEAEGWTARIFMGLLVAITVLCVGMALLRVAQSFNN